MAVSFETFRPLLDIRLLVKGLSPFSGWSQDKQTPTNETEATLLADAFANGSVYELLHDSALAKVTKNVDKVFTAQQIQVLHSEFLALFQAAKDEVFADGTTSRFSQHLARLVDNYGNMAINQIILLEEENHIPPEVLSETLRWLGQIEDSATYARRRWLLEHSLSHQSSLVRDGAILGLSFLEDPRVIPTLERAMAQEPSTILRADIQQVIDDLREMLHQDHLQA